MRRAAKTRWRDRVAGLVGLGLCLAVPVEASALSPRGPCLVVTPQLGKGVPVNAPALITLSGGGVDAASVVNDLGLKIDGMATPALIVTVDSFLAGLSFGSAYLVNPATPLAVGTHNLAYNDPCSEPPAPKAFSYPFRITEPVPLPGSIGTTKVSRVLVRRCPPTGEVLEHAIIELMPSPELLPFMAVALRHMSVNGKAHSRHGYGAFNGGTEEFGIIAACRRAPDSFDYLPPAKYDVTIGAHVAGAVEDPPPLTLTIVITCEGMDDPPTPAEQAACASQTWPRDAGPAASPPGDGSPPPPEPVHADGAAPADAGGAEVGGPAGCGCRVGDARGGGAALLLVLGALLSAVRRSARATARGELQRRADYFPWFH